MLLPNGSAIKQDVIESFDRAVNNEFNLRPGFGSTDFWNFVESDMYMELNMYYDGEYISACFDACADEYEWLMTGKVA
jgi:hypothetical protein